MKAVATISTPDGGRTQRAIDAFPAEIGRGPSCDVRLDSPSVSERHCTVLFIAGSLFVTDRSSTNGTFVNGARLVPGRLTRISTGDVVSAGQTRLEITVDNDSFSGGTRTIFRRMLDAAEILPDSATGPVLVVLNGPAAGACAALPVEDGASISAGRGADSVLRIPDRMASSRHFEVTRRAGAFFVSDTGSRNGTLVNGVRVLRERAVADGDEVTAGDTVILVVGADAPGAAPRATAKDAGGRTMERLVIPAASILGLVSIALAAVFVAYALG
jgi:pSer/pThr/pTyr-binding forkhead associated (FHA) protein